MKVLVIGGTGVISRAIVAELLARGREVTVFNRGQRRLDFAGDVRQITGDRQDRDDFRKRLQAARFDVVIDMICMDEADARSTVGTFAGRVSQIIVCSSSLAYRRPFRNVPVREDDELLCSEGATSRAPAFTRGLQKADMERYLMREVRERKLPVTIIRPSLTFGAGTSAFGVLRQNYGVIARIRAGKPLVMFGDGLNPWSFTFAPDLALAFAGAVGNPATYGQHYHATSEERTVWQDAYLELGHLLGQDVRLFHMSSEVLAHAAPAMCAHLLHDKAHPGYYDNSKIRRDVPDFVPRISLREGLRQLLAWYESDGAVVDPVKDALEDQLYAAHQALLGRVANLHPG